MLGRQLRSRDHAVLVLYESQLNVRYSRACQALSPALAELRTLKSEDRLRMWCLRHSESENVTAGVAGAVPSAPLTERGRHQAIQAAQALADEPITSVYSSTAVRAQQTAQSLAEAFNLKVFALTELGEANIGRYEGRVNPAARRRMNEVLRAWVVEQDLRQRVADGETGQQVLDRMTAAFQQIASTHPGATIAVVGHTGSLTLALSRLCALGPRIWGRPLPHGQPFLVESDGQTWHCRAWPVAFDVHES
jgi:broad specificity phosphatase PhoE